MVLRGLGFSFFATLAACATGEFDDGMSEKAAARLAEFEKTGEEVNCINSRNINSITALDDRHFLVRVGANRYYLNEVANRCVGASRTGNRIQYTIENGQLCRNEIIQVIDNMTGIMGGGCGLSSFQILEKKTSADADG